MRHFYAMMARMRLIGRWSLMAGRTPENVAEHSLMTAVFAHALASIALDMHGKAGPDPDACAAAAIFHDAPEILTGDMPTPVKYFSPGIREAYREVEEAGVEKLLLMLPEAMRGRYRKYWEPGEPDVDRIVRAADKLSAYVKCLEEMRAGNWEFRDAARVTREKLDAMGMPELDTFFAEFLPSFSLTLDEMQ
ncbi:MAG: 5'-deoxynucleotidase [Oscillospiraceae bacterium]|jgi:5'-deoxynucleotidase|nr:5'-deoxynucleotidase [Oscillospiraceae bacterium]